MILRPADPTDESIFFWIRNEPVALKASRRPVITEEEHHRWWTTTSDYLWVATDDDGRILGTLRLSPDGIVSIIVSSQHRGQGMGPRMLLLLEHEAKELGFKRIWAEIAPENVASQRAFLKAGWNPILLERGL